VRFAPTAPGPARATLTVPSDNGTLQAPVSALAPSVASLTWVRPAFEATGSYDRAGQVQRLVLELRNPLASQVPMGFSALEAGRRSGFTVESNRCRWDDLGPGAACRVAVLYRPRGPGATRATLIVRGGDAELKIRLRAGPFAPPAIKRVAAPECLTRTARVAVVTDQPALVRWRVLRWTAALAPSCGRHSVRGAESKAAPASASGRAYTVPAARTANRAVGRFALPRGLGPGTYVLSVSASNAHGAGESQTTVFSLLG
jgi:hypothetical protein